MLILLEEGALSSLKSNEDVFMKLLNELNSSFSLVEAHMLLTNRYAGIESKVFPS